MEKFKNMTLQKCSQNVLNINCIVYKYNEDLVRSTIIFGPKAYQLDTVVLVG